MGLTSQVPALYQIVTNKATSNYRETNVGKSRVIIKKPRTTVTEDNYKILQFLDLILDIDIYSEVEGKELNNRLSKYMRDMNISVADMKAYFKYYPDKLYKNLVETEVIYNDVPA